MSSARPSVTLADQDRIDWKSWKLTAWTISTISSWNNASCTFRNLA